MGERGLRIAMLVVRKTREQMQALFGAGGGDVKEARGLGVLGVGVEVLEVLVGEVLVGAGFLDGGQKQTPRTPLVRGANNFLPEEERWVAAPWAAVEAGDDDGVELEALGLVDGHDLQVVVARADVGERVEVLEALGEGGEVLDGAGMLKLLQLVEEDLGVLEVGRVLDAGRAAEREPDAFDAVAQGAAAAVGDRGGEDAREALEEEIVLDQLPDGLVAVAARDLEKFLQRQRKPWRAQDGEPGDAVAEVRKRAREGVEVLHHLLLAEALDLDGAVADARGLQRRDDLGERVAPAHQDGAAAFRGANEVDDLPGFA